MKNVKGNMKSKVSYLLYIIGFAVFAVCVAISWNMGDGVGRGWGEVIYNLLH